MQKWEYRIVKLQDAIKSEAELNRLGAEGWELVAAAEYWACLKRPISD
jgi:hypothetical protein